ncbi:acyl-CoA Delta-9 desaturase [Plodia interpunctella]|uniref:acyl-CoA Delta-9 desaturase n=1 Tax=Plodia interpunctella TaxID=58824 RepID=UPI00236894A0|nr:acyl-CoA Delta-9 desaturase-like [Plodia interpunctella]
MPGSPLTELYLKKKMTAMHEDDVPMLSSNSMKPQNRTHEWQIVWRNVFAFIYMHVAAIYGFYLMFTGQVRIWTVLFAVAFAVMAAMGVTAGAHRLWAHRAYKARWPLRLFLAVLQTMAFQNHIYEWVRDHRVHHKFTETDADPHNARRGFFFSHIGWLMLRKHKEVFEKGATVDMSDLEKDPIVMFQKKTYLFVMPLICFVVPAGIPVYFWGEDPWTSWYAAAIARYTLTLHFTWLVNSAAHIWGNRPYDKYIGATDNKAVAICAFGEGWHNYHHVFPWDYKAAELGNYSTNMSTALIDFAAKYGLAYDLKTVSAEMIQKRAARTGDGSHPSVKESSALAHDDHHHPENPVWGWDDQDLTEEDRKLAEIAHRKSD